MQQPQQIENGDTKIQAPEVESKELRILIDNSQVGAIIGKQGANVKQVREATSVYVSILKTDYRSVQERILVLKGQLPNIASACKLIFENIQIGQSTDGNVSADGVATVRLLIHKSTVGAIIGLGGVTIRETQAETGARIQISNEPLANSTDKTVSVTGTCDVIETTVYKVLSQLQQNPLKAGAREYPYVPGQSLAAMGLTGLPGSPYTLQGGLGLVMSSPYGAAAGGAGGLQGGGAPGGLQGQQQLGGYGGQPGMQASLGGVQQGMSSPGGAGMYGGGMVQAMPQTTSTQKIAIPTVTAGRVIGKSGATIRDIRMQSQTTISISDPETSNPEERVVTIAGTPQGIQCAIFLIRQLVEQYEPTV